MKTKKTAAKQTAAKKHPVTKKSSSTKKNSGDKKLPGYPHYPQSDDIMNSGEKKVPLDEPVTNRQADLSEVEKRRRANDPLLNKGTAADVSDEEALNLGDENLADDEGDDEDLRHRPYPVDMAGDDLDVPGSELDDDMEDIGEEDEENNLYSRSDNED